MSEKDKGEDQGECSKINLEMGPKDEPKVNPKGDPGKEAAVASEQRTKASLLKDSEDNAGASKKNEGGPKKDVDDKKKKKKGGPKKKAAKYPALYEDSDSDDFPVLDFEELLHFDGPDYDLENPFSLKLSDMLQVNATVDPINVLMDIEEYYQHHERVVKHLFQVRDPETICTTVDCKGNHYRCWACENVYCRASDYMLHLMRWKVCIKLTCPGCNMVHRFTNECCLMKHLVMHPDVTFVADYFTVSFEKEPANYYIVTKQAAKAGRENYDPILDSNGDLNLAANIFPQIHINISSVFKETLKPFWSYIYSDW